MKNNYLIPNHLCKLIKASCKVLGLALLSTVSISSLAQMYTEDNLYIDEDGEVVVFGAQTFDATNVVETARTGNRGYFSFGPSATWTAAANASHVDGYARHYVNGAFVMPIGDNGAYRPIATTAGPTDAAYYAVNPNGSYPVATSAANVSSVSTLEYWDIDGTVATSVTLTWNATSDIATITGSDLTKLIMVGWDGTEWVKIPATISTSTLNASTSTPAFTGGAGTLTAGSITTDATITPNDFEAFTFGSEAVFTDFGDYSGFGSNVSARYTDDNGDGTPDGVGSIWLGTSVSSEVSANTNTTATADADDGVTIPNSSASPTFNITLNINSSSATTAFYQIEIDEDNNGSIDQTITGSSAVSGPTSITQSVTLPASFIDPANFTGGSGLTVNYRIKVAASAADAASTNAQYTNGEIEDYQVFYDDPLPVNIVKFDVNAYNTHDAKLDWATASELNNSHFEVQRSFDGYNFSTIGEVKGNGTSHALINYNYIDKTIPTHENMVYYRLNQVDFDGESALTDVRLVQFEGFSNTPLVVYPNPTRNETTILLGNNVSQGNYTITDLVGKQWMADVVQSGSKSIQLDFSNLPSGVYIATLNADGQDSRHVRIVKH